MKIATLLTCFNRKNKTLSCLETLFRVLEFYNNRTREEIIELEAFLVDDGCTDGTADAIKEKFHDKPIHIIQGTGSLYWSRGMCLAWNSALQYSKNWDFYLLLNDDVDLLDNLFDELLTTHQYSLTTYGKEGLYSGITSSKTDHTKMTYGGNVWVNKFLGKTRRLVPTGIPQPCDMTHANILLIHRNVVEQLGIFEDVYEHGCSDYDYSIRARCNGFPILVTGSYCGRCEDDHKSTNEIKQYILNANLQERKDYFNNPAHSNKDQLTFIRRNVPMRYPIVYLGRLGELYFPRLYYWLSRKVR